MTGFWIRKVEETAERWLSRAKNTNSRKTKITIPTETSVVNVTLENPKDFAKIEEYNTRRKERIAISILFAIGLFLQIVAHAIL